MVAAVAVSIGVVQAWSGSTRPAVILVGLGLAVALVSLVDDLRGLPALLRLAVHLAAGAARWPASARSTSLAISA